VGAGEREWEGEASWRVSVGAKLISGVV
jgi:hypothetical protein